MTGYQIRLVLGALCDVYSTQALCEGTKIKAQLVQQLGLPQDLAEMLVEKAHAISSKSQVITADYVRQ